MVYPSIINTQFYCFVAFSVLAMEGENLYPLTVPTTVPLPKTHTVKERGRGGENACVIFYAE